MLLEDGTRTKTAPGGMSSPVVVADTVSSLLSASGRVRFSEFAVCSLSGEQWLSEFEGEPPGIFVLVSHFSDELSRCVSFNDNNIIHSPKRPTSVLTTRTEP